MSEQRRNMVIDILDYIRSWDILPDDVILKQKLRELDFMRCQDKPLIVVGYQVAGRKWPTGEWQEWRQPARDQPIEFYLAQPEKFRVRELLAEDGV